MELTHTSASPLLSFVLPLHNEAEGLRELHRTLSDVCRDQRYAAEFIFVDDGSDDGSFAILQELAQHDECIRVIQFRRNFGQTAALSAGIHASTGQHIVTLDADLQNDPRDVPLLLQKLEEGYDVVSGWRQRRKDNWCRRLPSSLANRLISAVTGVRLHDYGCTLKIYRREYLQGIPLYGEMHRFIPVFAAWQGAKVTELPVHHAPRRYGKSHYGLGRTSRVLLDLLTVKFLHTYIARPMHFFGGVGFWLMGGGVISGCVSVILKVMGIRSFVDTPLPLLTVFLILLGVQFLLMGLLAELLIRIYFGSSARHSYTVSNTIRCSPPQG